MRRAGKTLALLFATGVVCFVVAELATARLGLLEYPPAMSKGHPVRGYTLRPGFSGESIYGVPVHINSLGFRSPEIEIPKPPGTRRVLMLGDSVTFGAGAPEEDTFSRQLETRLRAELACPVEVVNAGISGYGSVQELDVLEHEGAAVEPDVVVVLHIENDNKIPSSVRGPAATFLKDWVVYRSHLVGATLYAWRMARWRGHAARAGGDEAAFAAQQRRWNELPGSAESLEALRQIGAVARALGAPVILASQPTRLHQPDADEIRNALLAELAAEEGMTFVDLRPVLLPHRDEDLAVSARDRHPNRRGHAIIAEGLRPAVEAALGCARRPGDAD